LLTLFGVRLLPNSVPSKTPFDAITAVLSASCLILIVLGVDNLASSPLRACGLILAGLATGYALVRRTRRQAKPLVPIDLFRLPTFTYSVVSSLFLFGAQMAAFVALPFYFQGVLGRNQV